MFNFTDYDTSFFHPPVWASPRRSPSPPCTCASLPYRSFTTTLSSLAAFHPPHSSSHFFLHPRPNRAKAGVKSPTVFPIGLRLCGFFSEVIGSWRGGLRWTSGKGAVLIKLARTTHQRPEISIEDIKGSREGRRKGWVSPCWVDTWIGRTWDGKIGSWGAQRVCVQVCVCCYCSNIPGWAMLWHFVFDHYICQFAFHLFFYFFCSRSLTPSTRVAMWPPIPTSLSFHSSIPLCFTRLLVLKQEKRRQHDTDGRVRNGRDTNGASLIG